MRTKKVIFAQVYLIISVVELLILFVGYSFSSISLPFYIWVSIFSGILVFFLSYRLEGTPITPASLFAVVWLLLVPATSGPAPMMEELNWATVSVIVMGGFIFGVVGFISSILFYDNMNSSSLNIKEISPVSGKLSLFSTFVVFLSCVALLLNFKLSGGVRIFDTTYDPTSQKTAGTFPGYSFLSSMGSVGILVLVYSKCRNVVDLPLAVIYIFLQLLTGQRWYVILTVLLIASKLSFKVFSRQDWLRTSFLAICLMLSFAFISHFRSSTANFSHYFVETGLYNGSAAELSRTEIVRYFGMSQRNMGVFFAGNYLPNYQLLFSRTILTPWGNKGLSLGTNINAYTANNILSYLRADAGGFWWILLAILVLLVHLSYFWAKNNTESILPKIIWGTSVLGISLSFFSYINAYSYWLIYYPVIFCLAERILSKRLPAQL